MMGNRGRVAKCFATLAEEGFSKEEIGLLHAPIGLNVGAESPFEIAVAILAELIQVRRSHSGSVSDWADSHTSAQSVRVTYANRCAMQPGFY